MLDALGLNPVIKMPWLAGTTCHPKTSVLKFAIVKELLTISNLFLSCPRCAAAW